MTGRQFVDTNVFVYAYDRSKTDTMLRSRMTLRELASTRCRCDQPSGAVRVLQHCELNQVSVVLSEDFNAGALIEGVRFVNPFDHDFNLDEWI